MIMKFLKENPFLTIGIVSAIIWLFIYLNNDYMESKDRKCVVLDKMTSPGGRRSSGHFYLILKEERGIIFDIIVSPATFSQSKIGDVKYFSLRQHDIRQSKQNTIYSICQILFFIVSLGSILIAVAMSYIYNDYNN